MRRNFIEVNRRGGGVKQSSFTGRRMVLSCMMLQAALRKEGVQCEVTDVGIGGERRDGALKRFAKDVIDLKPKAVTIMYGTNDS